MRALQQQMSASQGQSAALETQLGKSIDCCTSSCGITWSNHDGVEPWITKAWESHQCSQARKKTSTCGPRKLRTTCQVCFRTCVELLSFALESQDMVTAAAVALGVPDFDDETSAEIDGQLFIVLSVRTEGDSPTLRRQQEAIEASRVGASCSRGGTHTRQDVVEVF